MRILITGGAGYIGSVVAEVLLASGHQVTVFDNLSSGHRAAVPSAAEFVEGDLAVKADVRSVIRTQSPDAVMHFASRSLVGESIRHPFLYLRDNVVMGLNLLEACIDEGVNRFVLSSTANLFASQTARIDEEATVKPGSPYGESKWTLERNLHWLAKTTSLRFAILRYFNAAGASVQRGEHRSPETHLIPLVLQVALGKREQITIHGDDYRTEDGTCVRDYIHVLDVAEAHVLALDALQNSNVIYNLGNGKGFSVLEVIETARFVTGESIPTVIGARRIGDPAYLVANSDRIRKELGWQPKRPDLTQIIETAWDWQLRNPSGYADSN